MQGHCIECLCCPAVLLQYCISSEPLGERQLPVCDCHQDTPDDGAQESPTDVRIGQPRGKCIYIFLRHSNFGASLCPLEQGGAEGEPSTAVRA